MTDGSRFYIDGRWVDPIRPGNEIVVVNPATEEEAAKVAAASSADVEAAVQAAHRAFEGYSQTTREERIELLTRLREAYKKRIPEIAAAISGIRLLYASRTCVSSSMRSSRVVCE